MEIQPIHHAIEQLNRSERGIITCKLLLDLLDSNTVNGLDSENSLAAASLVAWYLLSPGKDARMVKQGLENIVDGNTWVK